MYLTFYINFIKNRYILKKKGKLMLRRTGNTIILIMVYIFLWDPR